MLAPVLKKRSNVQLVIIGHFGFAEDKTPFGSAISLGGSGYACAIGACLGDSTQVGIVGNIGDDFDVEALDRLGVDKAGANFVAGRAPRLTIVQHNSTDRSFESDLGVAALPTSCVFPAIYAWAKHVHLATMPPAEQAHWLRTVRAVGTSKVSVDMFEQTAAKFPDESRALCYSADMVLMNDTERQLLFSQHPLPAGDILLKTGPGGAGFRSNGRWVRSQAPSRRAVDTTGAGEVLAGAFLSLRALRIPVRRALHYAVELASAKVTEFGVDGENLRRTLNRVRASLISEGKLPDQPSLQPRSEQSPASHQE